MSQQKPNRSFIENIQVLALDAVENPDNEYVERRVQRVFSTTFNVSILEAEKLDLAYMLQHIYEYNIENAKPQERAKVAEDLLNPGQKVEEETEQSDEDDVWAAQQIEVELKKEQEKERKKAEEAKKKANPPKPEELPPDIKMNFDDD